LEEGVTLRIDHDRDTFAPGEVLKGSLAWDRSVGEGVSELSVLWFTEGKGDRDTGIVHFEENPIRPGGEHRFEIELPLLPLTYYGELIKIHWVLRVRVDRARGQDLLIELPLVLREGAETTAAAL
jgi:hypothetical protein